MAKGLVKNQSGFSIIEVLIALMIFGAYSTVMILTQVSNKDRSIRMAKDLKLHNLAEMKMNEVLLVNKEFTAATEKSPETGQFDIEGYENFKFEVQYKKNEFPDFSALMGQTEDESRQADPNAAIKKLIFEKMKNNIELMIWQVKVTVTNSDDDTSYELNSWITNSNAKLDTNFSL